MQAGLLISTPKNTAHLPQIKSCVYINRRLEAGVKGDLMHNMQVGLLIFPTPMQPGNMHIMHERLLIRLSRLLIESPGLLIKPLNQFFEPEKAIMHP
jgi:hypothetical protein